MNRLEGRRAIVTGAAQGIGLAIATRLNSEGCRVAMMDINEAQAISAAEGLEGCFGLACDVSSPASIEEALALAAQRLEGIDIIVNNAGILPSLGIEQLTEEVWDRTLAVNLKSVFFMTQKALHYLKESTCARVVNISSLAGRMGGFETCMAYTASKGGIISLTMGLARQLAPYKINVNAVCPGTTQTPITRAFTPEALEKLYARVPLGRLGLPEDIAAAAAFLASDDAAFITGALLDVNGGMYMG